MTVAVAGSNDNFAVGEAFAVDPDLKKNLDDSSILSCRYCYIGCHGFSNLHRHYKHAPQQ